jgi:hypothetical protein
MKPGAGAVKEMLSDALRHSAVSDTNYHWNDSCQSLMAHSYGIPDAPHKTAPRRRFP